MTQLDNLDVYAQWHNNIKGNIYYVILAYPIHLQIENTIFDIYNMLNT